ncbi:MAG: flagellar filament capping protein FliD [Bryobacteraceae bacterium]|jgi:flagellar hook-associated protein 2
MSTSSVSNPISVTAPQSTLTGASSYSSSLQAAVTRAVSIASLPMQLLQADQNQATSEATELGQLSSLFNGVQTALQSVVSGTASGALAATSSDTSVAQASLSGSSALPGTYTVDVLNAGSESSAISSAPSTPITDPTSQSISQSTSFTLTVGTQTYTIQPSGQNLNALASAINSSGAPAQAVVVNLGSPTAPDYRLVVQSTSLGNNTIQLNDGTNNLLNVLAAGASGSYTVDGQPPGGITTNSSTVTIASGVNVTLGGQTGPTTVTVSASLSSVSDALSNFVTAFNSAVAELQKNYGQNGGALTGDSSVLSMSQVLNQIATYTGAVGSSITNLTQLGVEFTDQGTLTFDPSVIAGLSPSQITDAVNFLGSPTTGGFLQYATNSLNGITDPTTGVIATESQSLQNQVNTDQTQINNDQAQITQLQANLQAQMAQADALIATLQQQNTFLQGLFQYATSNNPDVASAA